VRANRILLKACAIVLIVITPWFLALTALLPLISPPFLRLQYARPDIPPSTKFTPQERQATAEAAAHYLVSREGIEYLADLKDDQGLPLFNERELIHMVDVKLLLGKAIGLNIIFGVLLAGSLAILLSQRETRDRTPSYLFLASLVTLALCISAIVLVPLQFNFFFVEFHHVFFEGVTWLFPRSDTLIQLFPEMFWFGGLQSWILLVIIQAVALGAGMFVWMRRRRRRSVASL
jgi:integral membrane protein (TIGR01906 family)